MKIPSLKQEAQEWKEKYHHLLEQRHLAKQQRFDRFSETHIDQGELQFDEADSVETTKLPEEINIITVATLEKSQYDAPY
ncbi:TPA: hypothetical protein ACT9NA_003146 [Legionella pneumophila]